MIERWLKRLLHAMESRTMHIEQILAQANATNVAADWDDAHRFTPAPRHRRRLVLEMLKQLDFTDCLDAGCAQRFLLESIVDTFAVPGFGCDISDAVIEANRQARPDLDFRVLDLTQEIWPDRRFDLVVCSEVLEHITDWPNALANLVRMTGRHLVVTVPSGPIRTMDRLVGHHQHFRGPELTAALAEHGLRVCSVRHWGFPVHSAYKALISGLSPARLYDSFSGGQRYGWGKRIFSELLYQLFFFNDLFRGGCQLLVHAKRD